MTGITQARPFRPFITVYCPSTNYRQSTALQPPTNLLPHDLTKLHAAAERQLWVDKYNLRSSVVQIEFLLENISLRVLFKISGPLPILPTHYQTCSNKSAIQPSNQNFKIFSYSHQVVLVHNMCQIKSLCI